MFRCRQFASFICRLFLITLISALYLRCQECGENEIFDPSQDKCVLASSVNSSHFHSSGSNYSSSGRYNESYSYEEWNRTKTKHYGSNCSLGYTWNISTNACEDIDECSLPEEKCAIGSKCKNTPGSFQCERHTCELGFKLNDAGECAPSECKEGYIYSPVWNECKDINECQTNSHHCSFKCVNTLGSYHCICEDGEKLKEDNKTCEADPCLSNPCGEFDDCINENGTHSCVAKTDAPDPVDTQPCGPGMLEDEKGNCVKGNPCKTPGICEHKCTYLGPGQHVCECPLGFDLNLTDNKSCVDIDECSKGITHCPDVCTNTIGSFKCECEEGMKPSEFDPNDCVDIDECEKPELNNCTARSSVCFNLTPGFKCNCLPGFRRLGHDHFSQCLDINECDGDPCTGPKQLCENTPGSYKCTCESGYEMDDETNDCKDIDECAHLEAKLAHPLKCHNTEGSYYMRCPNGFRPNNVTLTCDDKNECETSPCGEGSICVNTVGSYKCKCSPGFKINHETKTCEDVNECDLPETQMLCKHGCENEVGAFRCKCPEDGYFLMPDNVTCQDVNECDLNNECAEICVNTVGSYRCDCNIGFALLNDSISCGDINECEDLPDSCISPATCKNTIGSFVCTCPRGFTLNENNFTCNDINECLSNETCSNSCINTYGSHVCLCPNGYKLKNDRKSCTDIDECEDESACNKYTETCINKDGGYSCNPKCPAGYKPTNTSIECEDIDECNEGLSKCNPGDTCENLAGGYYCRSVAQCPNGTWTDEESGGRKHNKTSSEGSEEKEQGGDPSGEHHRGTPPTNQCDEGYVLLNNGTCVKYCDIGFGLNENLTCVRIRCPPGFYHGPNNTCLHGNCSVGEVILNNGTCQAIECKKGYVVDHNNGCVAIQCKPGFELNEAGEECIRKLCPFGQFLSFDGNCVQLMPCPDGYELKLDGKCHETCSACNVTELTTTCFTPDMTPSTAEIISTVGITTTTAGTTTTEAIAETTSYLASTTPCPEGFIPDIDGNCIDESETEHTKTPPTDEGKLKPCPPGTERSENGTCETRKCSTGYREAPDGQCVPIVCYPGYHFNKTAGECTDVDDCLKPEACFSDEQCLNQEGSYSCILCETTKSDNSCTIRTICPPGFEFDTKSPTRCKDIDECAIFRNICPRNKECRNVFGSYRCEEARCPPGYEMKSGSCHDIDECRLKLHACEESQECRNIAGSYRCEDRQQCPPGFQRDSSHRCVDIDECQRFGSTCEFECINTIGSYRCSCPIGYRLLQNGKSCEDVDECKMNPLICEGFCENTLGSFECRCELGFEKKEGGECADINECVTGKPCGSDELCFNTYSSYKCMKVNCPPGYIRYNGKCVRRRVTTPPCERYDCYSETERPARPCVGNYPPDFHLTPDDPMYSLWRLYFEQKRCEALEKLIDELIKSRTNKDSSASFTITNSSSIFGYKQRH